MPKLKCEIASKIELKSLNTNLYHYLSENEITMKCFSEKIQMNVNTLYGKINGLITMRKKELEKINNIIMGV